MTALPWIDWDAAEQVGLELVDPGPRVGRPERAQIVTQLREQARRAADLLVEASGLPEVGDARELVVDRRNIIRANVATARRLTSESIGVADSPLEAAAGRARGATIGGVLAVVAPESWASSTRSRTPRPSTWWPRRSWLWNAD